MNSCRAFLSRAFAALFVAAALAACGGSDGPPPPSVGSATIGLAGGTVDGPDGVRLVVPPDAVASETTFRVARSAADAPALNGLNAASPVYEVTPHNQPFDQPALFSIPLSAATNLPAGTTPLLLKASPGGKWRVLNDTQRTPGALSADVEALSWFVLAYCARTGATTGWIIGEVDCPADNSLKLELLDSNGTPIVVSPTSQNTLPPLVRVTGPTTLNFRLAWTRAPGTTRVDYVAVFGSNGFRPGFSSTWGVGLPAGGVQETSIDLVRYFSVTINPEQTGTTQLRVNASAEYGTTAFQVGTGNVGVGFEFSTYIPITVTYSGTLPTITQQTTPASVSVVENGSFSLSAAATGPNLSYEWRYYENAGDSAVRVAEGTNNQATYTSPPVPLGFNGRLYYVQICSNRGVAGREQCISTQATPLTVTQLFQGAAFTTQPINRDIVEREGLSLSAAVTGTPTPALQWHYGVSCTNRPIIGRSCTGTPFADGAGPGALAGATVSGATTATLNLAAVPLAASGTTLALAATQSGVADAQWSDVATLTVRAAPTAPTITAPLTPQSATVGGSATFVLGVAGTEVINLEWSIGGRPLVAPGTFLVPRTSCSASAAFFDNNRRLVLSALTEDCSGLTATVQASNAVGGPVRSSALLTVTAAPSAPAISEQPAASTINEDTATALRVGYGGTGPVTLALQRYVGGNWTTVSSTTSAACVSPCSLPTPTLPLAENGAMFRVRLSNSLGTVDSNAVTITVNISRAPLFTRQPAAAAVDANLTTTAGTANFQFAISDEIDTLVWQWLLNGQPLADGSGVAGNGLLQQATVSGATGTLTVGTPGALTVSNLPLAANGAQLSARVTRTGGGQSRATTSTAAVLTVNSGIPANALTATQIVAGPEWSMVLRPDRTVWGWGSVHRANGTVQYVNPTLPPALRPVRMYPAALSDVRAISGWFNSFWALKGEPGSTGSRVLHWGRAYAGSDGRGVDGNGGLSSAINPSIPSRDNETAPVEVLERVNNVPRPVDRVCAIAGGGEQLAMIRAINSAGTTTDCNAGSAKTVWYVGSLLGRGYESTGLAFAMPGLPSNAPPAVIFAGQTTSGSPGLAIALEDGRVYGLGANPYGGYGVPSVGGGPVGDLSGPQLLPNTWGNARSFGMSFYYSLFVVRADGSVVTSGYDNNGELGLGGVVGGSTLGPLPVKAESCTSLPCVDGLTGVSTITGTYSGVTLALKNGRILAWGAGNGSGLRGPGATTNQPFPRAVPSAVAGFSSLSASHFHALAIGPGNVVYAWGSGLRGALGDGVDGSSRVEPGLVTP